jgi:hypothetical protein
MKESQFDPSAGLLNRYPHMAVDGGRLYVGSHGRAYAFAVDGRWAEKNGQEWRTDRLSDLTDHAPVTMLYADDRLFAACDGYMYELDLFNGQLIETWLMTTELANLLDFSVTLAVRDDDGFAGLHGYAYGLLMNGLEAAPTAAWQLVPPSDDKSAPDQRGIHPATATGVTWQKLPAVGGCAVFNAIKSEVSTARGVLDTTLGKSFTVSAWVRLDEQPPRTDFAVLSQVGEVVSGFTLGYSVTDGAWFFQRAATDTAVPKWVSVSVKATVKTGSWYHVAAVYDAGALTADGKQFTEMRLSVNGARAAAAPVEPTAGFKADGPFQIGVARSNREPVQRLKGAVRDVRVYNRALDDLLLEPQGAAFWRLDDDSDAVRDLRDAHPATAKGVTWEWIKGDGYVANFNGTTSGVSTKSAVVDTGAGGSFTVAGWVRVAGGASGTLLGQEGQHCMAFNFSHVSTRPGTARWFFTRADADTASPGTVSAATNVDIPNGTWAHLAGVYNAAERIMRVYLNGTQRDAVVYQSREWASEGPFAIGYGKFTSHLNGSARDVRAYTQALSEQQIKDLLVAGAPGAEDGTED